MLRRKKDGVLIMQASYEPLYSCEEDIRIPGIPGTFSVPDGMHTSLPLLLLPGWDTMAGNRVISSTPARIVFAGSPKQAVSPEQVSAEIAKLEAARRKYAAIWEDYDRACDEWEDAMMVAIAPHVREEPTRREIKCGRRISRSEGRAMALSIGFDPSLHGYYHSDPIDEANAFAEWEDAMDVWRKEKSALQDAYAQAHPRPLVPDVPSPASDPTTVSRYAHLFGY